MARVVLVGMMGAGKSTVGARLAERLGWAFVDLDREVERAAGRSVAELFASEGEAAFRAREARAAEAAAGRERVVLAPGGGWIERPGALEALGEGTLAVWLRVSPEEAVRRAGEAPGERPLLAGPDPLGAARRLLLRREPHYAAAPVRVETAGRTVDEVTDEIEAAVRARGILPG